MQQLDQRYQWTILPQRMRNSPTICHSTFPSHFTMFLMMSITWTTSCCSISKRVSLPLLEDLVILNLWVAPEKLQSFLPYAFLGFAIAWKLHPLSFSLTFEDQYTLADLQQLCGSIDLSCFCSFWSERWIPCFLYLICPLARIRLTFVG